MNTTTTSENYRTSVLIKASPLEVFRAITERIDKWWGEVDRQPSAKGVEFRVSFGEAFWSFRVMTFEPEHWVTWECIESNQVHAGLMGIKEEWLGTRLHWEIASEEEGVTRLSFTHEGLIPDFNCYKVCSDAWGFFIGSSLKELAEKGQGQPELM